MAAAPDATVPGPANPPIVELAIGVQFSPLSKLTLGHYGLFWQTLMPEWVKPGEAPRIAEQFEVFGQSHIASRRRRLAFEPFLRTMRFTLEHKDKDKLIQLQESRFHLNWRRLKGKYPSFEALSQEFSKLLWQFDKFVTDNELGKLAFNQWELTYTDAFPKGDRWQTPADWSEILPGLFGQLFSTDGIRVQLERRAAEWSFLIDDNKGRLHVAARTGRVEGEEQESLLLNMTARGPVDEISIQSVMSGLKFGHQIVHDAFMRLTSSAIQKSCEA